jgi:hypothetical protein
MGNRFREELLTDEKCVKQIIIVIAWYIAYLGTIKPVSVQHIIGTITLLL